ncbi:MAG: hypothetical protein KGD64_05980 [Candidatus Heimdallarchaeota archaeon]|nr:hypothetical protein [Candidatus Heimdallarchaeota archaeon]
MIERVHEHLLDELKTNTRTDTIFIITAILLNIVTASINAAIAGDSDLSDTLIFAIFIVLVLVINTVVFFGLARGKQTRQKLLEGLLRLYDDQKVSGYYDSSILGTYNFRYILFTIVVIATGIAALGIPIILKILP